MVASLLLVVLLMLIKQVSSLSSNAELLQEPAAKDPSSSSGKRNLVPSCGPQQGSFMIEATYEGAAGTFNIATTALGEDANAPEIYHLQPFDDDLSNGVTYQGCFLRNSLYRFVVYVDQEENDGKKPPRGEYILTVNGRQIVSETTQSISDTFTPYFFSGDSHGCTGDMFTLTLQFDKWPFEIDWILENLTDEEALSFTYESTLKQGCASVPQSYSSDFDNALLFVDHCLVSGDQYRFVIFDQAGDGLLAPSYYEISSSDAVIFRQEGNFGSSYPTYFQSDGTVSTAAPVAPVAPVAPGAPISMPFSTFEPVPSSLEVTDKPAAAPARTPVSFPEPPPQTQQGLVFCFTTSTTVFVKSKGTTKMSELRIGDYVAVGIADSGSKIYEPVYSFGHFEPTGYATGFLELSTNQTSTSLQVSPDHLVFVYRSKILKSTRDAVMIAVPAASIRVGDLLVHGDNQAALVESIKPLHDSTADNVLGLYAPFTPSGKFLVNEGLLVSSFIGFDHLAESVPAGWSTEGVLGFEHYLSHHWLAHSFEFPHRVMCYHLNTCPDETYTKNGLSTWVAWPMELALRWMKLKSELLKATLLVTFVLVCSIFTLLELVLFQQPCRCMTSLLLLSMTLWLLPKKVALSIRKQVR